MTHLLLLIAAVAMHGCAVARPFHTVAHPAPGSTIVVAVTHARYRPEESSRFWALTGDVLASLPARDGLLGHSVRRRLFGNEVWTMTTWESPTALRAFIRSTEHRNAMKATDELVVEARFARFNVSAGDFPPTWERALAELAEVPAEQYGPSIVP